MIMKKKEIEAKVIATVQTLSDSTQIKEDSILEDIGITSLKFIRLVVELEKECEMRFEDNDINVSLFNNIQDITNYIWNKKNNI